MVRPQCKTGRPIWWFTRNSEKNAFENSQFSKIMMKMAVNVVSLSSLNRIKRSKSRALFTANRWSVPVNGAGNRNWLQVDLCIMYRVHEQHEPPHPVLLLLGPSGKCSTRVIWPGRMREKSVAHDTVPELASRRFPSTKVDINQPWWCDDHLVGLNFRRRDWGLTWILVECEVFTVSRNI